MGLSNNTSVHFITTEIQRVAVMFMLQLLSYEKKQYHTNIFSELPELFQTDPDFLSKVITGDKSYMYEYDPETKQQSSW